MNCDPFTFDFLREAFPKIDVRVIKATVLEHGDDVETALIFLKGLTDDEEDEEKDALPDEEGIESVRTWTTTLKDNAVTEPETALVVQELTGSNSQVSLASLEEVVEEAKKDKESVINLVKEVSELRAKADQERAAALAANIEAANSGEGLLQRADELRRKVSEKKQYNLLRVGEIYGEKAVLATEARGLTVRLDQLKLQKERALTTLNEIKARLQGFYEEAMRERMEAEEDRRQREKFAQETLAAEEEVMAMVEEESKKLDMEAEACAQLKEFLSHHGSIIDSLQGEICVLCEDVESFKRQVNDNMWSSASIASLPAYVNPEGPYTFRKLSIPSTSSSQELGQSFEALCASKEFCSRVLSGSSSQEMSDCVVEPASGSSQGYDRESQQQLESLGAGGWHLSQANAESATSLLGSREAVTSKIMDSSWHQRTQSSSSRLCDSRDSDTGNVMGHDWYQKLNDSERLFRANKAEIGSNPEASAGSNSQVVDSSLSSSGMTNESSPISGIDLNRSVASSRAADMGYEFTEPSNSNAYTADGLYFNFLSSPQASDDWVVSREQMEASSSSTSSSLIKVEVGDYHSD